MKKRFDRLVHRAQIVDGKLVLDNPKWFSVALSFYEDSRVNVLVEKVKSKPSSEQWGYLWGIVYPEMIRVTGHTPEELHQIMKRLHLEEKHVWRGMDLLTVRGASELSLNELAEFITNVIATAGEMGIEIPEPDKLYQFR